MQLNTLKPSVGSKQNAKRVGRGEGSGWGKTCSRGQKGQKSRSGGYHKVGFEGGQMPIQRRLPKFGFRSRMARFSEELRLHEIEKFATKHEGPITIEALIKAGTVPVLTKRVKVIFSGKIVSAVHLEGVKATKGARAAIEAAGGSVK